MNLVPWRSKRRDNGSRGETSSPLMVLRDEMDRLMDRFMREPFGYGEESTSLGMWAPQLDISESDKEVTVRAEVPGIDPKDLDVSITGNVLTLSGEKRDETEQRGENFFHSERTFGSFRRAIQLPASVDSEKVNADYANGVLSIHLQKAAGAEARKIQVRAEGNGK